MGSHNHFAKVPHAVVDDPEIDSHAQGVYTVLQRFTDFEGETGAIVSDRTIAEKLGRDRRTVIRRRELLRDKGWIDWVSRKGKTNRYWVFETPREPVTHSHTSCDSQSQPCDPGSHPPVTHSHTTKRQTNKRHYQEDGLAELRALYATGGEDDNGRTEA